MLLSLVVVAGTAALGQVDHYMQNGHYGGVVRDQRPIATPSLYPPGMADDVRRPGYNGRLWVSRPIMGSVQQGPYAVDSGTPGTESYGAYGSENDPIVYARVCHLVVGVDPWQTIPQAGYRRYEQARNFWLQEQGYTGGVRTFVNDAYVWKSDQAAGEQHASSAKSDPAPRATIQLPADMPRQRRRIRVDAGGPAPAQLVVCPGEGQARISWPMSAPADAVARTAANGNAVFSQAPTRVVSTVK
jgi:hypothetical protein